MRNHDRLRWEKLKSLLRENHVTQEEATKEARTGPMAARSEERARRPGWRMTTKEKESELK